MFLYKTTLTQKLCVGIHTLFIFKITIYSTFKLSWIQLYNRPFPPTFAICRNCQKLRYWVGFVGVLSVNAGERRSPSERSNPAFRVCIN